MNNSIDIVRTVAGISYKIAKLKALGKSVGFVPTMGALHEGHASLLKEASKHCDIVVCSTYANPTQFDNQEDLKKYPRTEKEDIDLLQRQKVAIAFIPQTADIYYNLHVKKIDYGLLSSSLEGAHRPGHFDGMSTIVRRLLNIVRPHLAFFGEKDWQQLAIIRHMNAIEELGVKITSCPIIREPSGLAMSSRNSRLSATDKKRALVISRVVLSAAEWSKSLTPGEICARGISELSAAGLEVEYVVVVDPESFEPRHRFDDKSHSRILVAAYCGNVRLIDNGII